jgi:tRNA A-37 threonylcarbamoyl transferase component Bud32
VAPPTRIVENSLKEEILDFCKHIAGSSPIVASYLSGHDRTEDPKSRTTVEVVLVIQDYHQRLLSFGNVIGKRNVFILAVNHVVFERDVERGILGEAVVVGLLFTYTPLINAEYLHLQEVKLKKRLIKELLGNLILDFPESSYDLCMEPDYFTYATMTYRTRLFPPMIYDLMTFFQEDRKEENLSFVNRGYSEALDELKKEGIIEFQNGYIKMCPAFIEASKCKTTRFLNLLKSGQRTLFASMLGAFPKLLGMLSQNIEFSLNLQRLAQQDTRMMRRLEQPEDHLFVPTLGGLVPFTNRMNIQAFASKVLFAKTKAEIEVQQLGGFLNDVFLLTAKSDGKERKIVAKRFRDWSNFKWFPLTLWSLGTRTFAVQSLSRLERESAISQFLYSRGFNVPKVVHVSLAERLIFTEYVEGEDLATVIKRIAVAKKQADVQNDLEVITKVGETFAQIHALGIALGDTKPENIIVDNTRDVHLLDFEQASRKGDCVWDVAEFLYYAAHDLPPRTDNERAELIVKSFITGYLKAGGNLNTLRDAGKPKYTKVFSIFTLPHLMILYSNYCRNAEKLVE